MEGGFYFLAYQQQSMSAPMVSVQPYPTAILIIIHDMLNVALADSYHMHGNGQIGGEATWLPSRPCDVSRQRWGKTRRIACFRFLYPSLLNHTMLNHTMQSNPANLFYAFLGCIAYSVWLKDGMHRPHESLTSFHPHKYSPQDRAPFHRHKTGHSCSANPFSDRRNRLLPPCTAKRYE